jgi:hypothetical protein
MKKYFRISNFNIFTIGSVLSLFLVVTYFMIKKSYADKDGLVRSITHSPPEIGTGLRRTLRTSSLSKQEIASILDEIALSYLGRDKERALFLFLKGNLGNKIDVVFQYSVEKEDALMAEALGHCIGCLGNANWVSWMKELEPIEYKNALIHGYFRGLGSSSPLEIELNLEMLGYDTNDRTLWEFALLELGQNSNIDENLIFDMITSFPDIELSNSYGFSEAIRTMISNFETQSLEKVIFQDRFRGLGETLSKVIAGSLAEKDPEIAIRWSMSLKDFVARQDGVGTVFEKYIKENASEDKILDVIDKSASRGLPRVNMINIVTSLKLQQDPMSAARFFEKLPPSEINSRYYAVLTGKWYQQDGLAASEWVSNLPVGRQKDVAIMVLTSEISVGDPATARQWAETIGDPDLKAKTLSSIEMR